MKMLKKEHNHARFKWLTAERGSFYVLSLLLIITFFAYKGLLSAEFLDYDDNVNIVHNQWIQGFTPENLKTIFTSSFQYSYNPVTFIFYALEYQLFGVNPTWFHLVNILLHLANTLLVFRLAFLLSNKKVIGIITATLFALHPIQADVIGWASAQNYLLATFFYLSSVILYIQHLTLTSSKKTRLFLSLLFFALACLSKSQAVTLAPLILLLNWIYRAKYNPKLIFKVSGFFIIALITGLLTIFFRSDFGKAEIIPAYTLLEKACVISFSLIRYVYKVFFPVGLTAIEAFPGRTSEGHLPVMVYLSPVILIAAGILIIRFYKTVPLVIFGLLYFFLNILITQVSFLEDGFSANRYFYLSSVGIFLPLSWLVKTIYDKMGTVFKRLTMAAGITVMVLMVFQTNHRAQSWLNTYTFSTAIIENSPGVAMAHNIRGIWHYKRQNYTLSVSDLSTAISLFPGYSVAYYNRGLSYTAMQEYLSARADYEKAIGLNPDFVSAYLARGVLNLDITQNFRAALNDFDKAVALDPANARAYYNRGLARFRLQDIESACADWRKVKSLGYSQADAMLRKYCR